MLISLFFRSGGIIKTDFVLLMTFESALDKTAAVARLANLYLDTSDFDNSPRVQVEYVHASPAPPPPSPPPTAEKPSKDPAVTLALPMGGVDLLMATKSAAAGEAKEADAVVAAISIASKKAAPMSSRAMIAREKAIKALKIERLIASVATKARASAAVATVASAVPNQTLTAPDGSRKKAKTAALTGSVKLSRVIPPAAASKRSAVKEDAGPKVPTESPSSPQAVTKRVRSRRPKASEQEVNNTKAVTYKGAKGGVTPVKNQTKKITGTLRPQPTVVRATAKSKPTEVSPPPPVSVGQGQAKSPTKNSPAAAAVNGQGIGFVNRSASRSSSLAPPAKRSPSPVPPRTSAQMISASGQVPSRSPPTAPIPAPAESRALSPPRRGSTRNISGGADAESKRPLVLKAHDKQLVVLPPSGPPDPYLRKWPYRFSGDFFKLLERDAKTGERLPCDPSKNSSYVGVIPPSEVVFARLRAQKKQQQAFEVGVILGAPTAASAVIPTVSAIVSNGDVGDASTRSKNSSDSSSGVDADGETSVRPPRLAQASSMQIAAFPPLEHVTAAASNTEIMPPPTATVAAGGAPGGGRMLGNVDGSTPGAIVARHCAVDETESSSRELATVDRASTAVKRKRSSGPSRWDAQIREAKDELTTLQDIKIPRFVCLCGAKLPACCVMSIHVSAECTVLVHERVIAAAMHIGGRPPLAFRVKKKRLPSLYSFHQILVLYTVYCFALIFFSLSKRHGRITSSWVRKMRAGRL